MTTVHAVVPAGIDDPGRPSGGNVYDRHVCRGLAAEGWCVRQHPVSGSWPWPDSAARARLADVLDAVPDRSLVLIDGLLACSASDVVVPRARGLHVVVLLHMPLGESRPEARGPERTVLASAAAVVTTSSWARRWVLDRYDLPARQVHVAEPGVDVAPVSPGTPEGNRLLCVGAVTPVKGQDLLVAALGELVELPWTCHAAGALDLEPGFVQGVRHQAERLGIADRLLFRGPLAGSDLDAAYAAADVLVLASRAETYGMVVTEALARGLPVIATAVGGVPEALGRTPAGRRPGLLVPPDAVALAGAIRTYLTDRSLREDLQRVARDRRRSLQPWSETTVKIARILTEALGSAPGEPKQHHPRTSLQHVRPPPGKGAPG